MTKIRLLQAACTIVLLAASPVYAQSNTPTGDTGAGGATNAPTMHEAMPGGTDHPASHHMTMAPHHGTGAMHASKNGKDVTADRLNEQSLQAAHQGQAFSAPGSAVSGPTGGSTSGGASSGAKM